MTTKTDVKKFYKPLLARHSDLVERGSFLIVTPVRRCVRWIVVERTSSKDMPECFWTANPLVARPDGGNIYTGRFGVRGTLMRWSQPETLDQHRDLIETEWLPFLRRIDTLADHERELNEEQLPRFGYDVVPSQRPDWRVLRAAGQGRFAEALPDCEFFAGPTFAAKNWRLRPLIRSILSDLYPALKRGDKSEVAAVLHAWEAETVRNLGLEAWHERTPFPFEEA